jgi:hypothetical protein
VLEEPPFVFCRVSREVEKNRVEREEEKKL